MFKNGKNDFVEIRKNLTVDADLKIHNSVVKIYIITQKFQAINNQ